MATRLEISQKKLDRLNNEFASKKSPMHGAPLGQPIVMNSSGRRMARKMEKHQNSMFSKLHEIQKQEKRVESLEWRENMKSKGLNASGGLVKSVENLERWEKRVNDLESTKAWFKANKIPLSQQFTKLPTDMEWYSSVKLKDAKETVAMLKAMKEKSEQAGNEMSELTKELIEDGSVNQWAKKPIYYFVKGLRKVALEINESGNFEISKRYPASSPEDKNFIAELLHEEE
ncbi:MAG: hypothetical protein LBH78_03520 [Rickettsiales bacterium]|jgi:hypothetical protein|nr:hypothetical protein [Rickettsiales bacterium]